MKAIQLKGRIIPTPGTQQAMVLDALFRSPLTDEELRLVIKIGQYAITSRRGELVRKGWVENSGQRRMTDAGVNAIVWQVKG